MKLIIDIKKSVEQNAGEYFEKAKKFKKKVEGIKEIIESQKKKLEQLQKERGLQLEKLKKIEKKTKEEKKWYEKFHWFYSSDGFLVIAGKDATSNEIVVKKHAEKNDLVLHAEIPGSPFAVIKSDGREIPETTIREAAIECAAYSKAWKLGIFPEVFYVKPEQVTKKAPSGEYIAKGAFMIYGKKSFVKGIEMKVAIGIKEGKIIGGPVSAIKTVAEKFVAVVPGDVKKSELAKKIQKVIGGEIDDIIISLPGDGRIE